MRARAVAPICRALGGNLQFLPFFALFSFGEDKVGPNLKEGCFVRNAVF